MKKLKNLSLTEYDIRQLKLMKEALTDYEENKVSLNLLINRLGGLLNCLQDLSDEWKENFHENWFELEQMYAVALDRNEPISKYSIGINESIGNLKKLLEFY